MTVIYGIKNCGTMKKAFTWLDKNNIEYSFHDYKKYGVDEAVLNNAIQSLGWEQVLNKRGTTWRKLDKSIQDNMNAQKAVEVALENPSTIKRPLLRHNEYIHLSFKADEYTEIFKE